MPEAVYLVAVLCGIMAMAAALYARQGFRIHSILQIFLIVWGYYVMAAPLDALLGFSDLALLGSPLYLDLNTAEAVKLRYPMLLHQTLLLCGCLVVYICCPLKGGRHKFGGIAKSRIKRPRTEFAVLINLICLSIYLFNVRGLSRQDIQLLTDGAGARAFIFELPTFLLALNSLLLLQTPSLSILAIGLFSAFLSDNRTYIVLLLLLYSLSARPRLSWLKFTALGILLLLLLLFAKGLHSNFRVFLDGERVDDFQLNPFSGFSGMEAADADGMHLYFIGQGPSPMWMGKSYVTRTFDRLTPTAIKAHRSPTLAQDYGKMFNPTLVQSGGGIGFSGILEAWLNFGWIGPLLAGTAIGVICRVADHLPRPNVLTIIAICIVMRFFRSDAASMIKTWLIVFGLWLLVASILIHAIRHIKPPRLFVLRSSRV